MPMFIFPQPGGSPLLSLLVGLAAIAIVIGLIIFFLPLILWGWIKRKFGLESSDERRFREAMEAAQRTAREQFRSGMKPSGTVYEREEVLVTKIGQPQRRRMQDVEDIEENPPQPNEKETHGGKPNA